MIALIVPAQLKQEEKINQFQLVIKKYVSFVKKLKKRQSY